MNAPSELARSKSSPQVPSAPPKPSPGRRTRSWIVAGLVAVTLVAWLKSFVGWVVVDGESMRPTFRSGDIILVDKRSYGHELPRRGDVVVSRFLSEYIVKRVVGLPGETVEVVDGIVRVNGALLPEDCATGPGTLNVRPGDLLPDRLAVLGDNREETDQQLFYAVVPREAILGKVVAALRMRPGDFHLWRTSKPTRHSG